jgi:hypothetical protein
MLAAIMSAPRTRVEASDHHYELLEEDDVLGEGEDFEIEVDQFEPGRFRRDVTYA